MTPVRFIQQWRLWNAGEIAGFPQAEAAALIEAGIAQAYTPENATPDATAAEVSEPHQVAQGAKPPRGKKG